MSERKYSKPPVSELRSRLSPLQFHVTQEEGTEPPFRNAYWDHHDAGLYVDVVSGEPLFASTDKFDSGTGWPSFTRPVDPERVVTRTDRSHGMRRVEVRSRAGDSHLGHVFEDGPPPSGLRYCINSASLRFVPLERLEAEGYGAYRDRFEAGGAQGGEDRQGQSAAGGAGQAAMCGPPDQATSDPAPHGCEATVEEALLAGGCFWGMQEILRQVPGVLETEVGYTGGHTPSPTYEQVSSGRTGHAEAVRVVFDPRKLSYAELLEKWFFRMHDPTTRDRQGHDVGSQYRSAIFVSGPEQRRVAQEVMERVERSGRWPRPLATSVEEAGSFTPAEQYHQDYLQKHPGGYSCHYLRD